MPMFTVACPNCATGGSISLVDTEYEGPYKCWKCHSAFSIRIQGENLTDWQPLSKEELERQRQADDMKRKFMRGASD